MLKKDDRRHVTKAAGQISAATTGSRILGFIRDILLAKIFGATGFTDAFFVAYRIPNLLRELFAEGSVSAGYVPVFSEYLTKQGKDEARKLAGVVLAFMLSLLLIICLLGILAAPYIARIVAPNFVNSPAQFDLTVKLLRIMFPFLIFISLAALAMGTLNSLKVFFLPALAPAFFNLVVIFFALFVTPHFTVPIVAIGLAVTAGGAMQYAVQIVPLARKGLNASPCFSFSHPGLKRILLLVLPVVLATGVMHINVLISNAFASYLPEGSVTYLYYSYRLILFPIGIFGISVAMALLPSLSEQAVKGDMKDFRETFSFSLRLVFFTSIPAMAGLIALAEPIVSTLFQRDQFTSEATKGTAYALIFYSSGIWVFSGLRVVRAAFYAMQDTKTPLYVALFTVIINFFLCYILRTPLKHGGLALALVVASAVNFVFLVIILKSKLGRIEGRKIGLSFIKTSLASCLMGLAGYFTVSSSIWNSEAGLIERAGVLAVIIAFCVGLYILTSYLMKSDELQYLIKMRQKRKRV